MLTEKCDRCGMDVEKHNTKKVRVSKDQFGKFRHVNEIYVDEHPHAIVTVCEDCEKEIEE